MRPLQIERFPLDGVSLIEASAGTGKTYSIVRLYLRHVLERGRRADQIVVASFTNAAATELRQRIRLGLEEALAASETVRDMDSQSHLLQDQRPVEQRDPSAIAYLVGQAIRQAMEASGGTTRPDSAPADEAAGLRQAALRITYRLRLAQLSLDSAPIGTIDALCGRWATEYALQAGISLLARERSDGRPQLAAAIRNEVLYLQGLPADAEDARLLSHLRDVTRSAFHLERWLERMLAMDGDLDVTPPDLNEARRTAHDALAHLAAALETHSNRFSKAAGTMPGLLLKQQRLSPLLAALSEQTPLPPDVFADTEALAKAPLVKGWMTDKMAAKAEPEWLADIEALRTACVQIAAAPLMDALRRSARRVRAGLARIKADQDVVTFDDLTRDLREALASNAGLRAQIARDYPVALVDEFQDSSPAQSAIFQHVYAGTNGADETSGTNGPARIDGALVMIGDPKQAIYAFRGGDVFAYLKARQAAGGNQYRLPKNFRSTQAFVDAINQVFEQDHTPFATEAIVYEPVQAGAPWANDHAAAAGVPLDVRLTRTGTSSAPGIDKTAAPVLRLVAEHLDPTRTGAFDLTDDARLTPRAARPGDLAILVRTNRGARVLYEALSANGYPVATRTQDSIFDAHEARELLQVLTALVHPTDASRVRGALTTDLLGHTLHGLRAHRDDVEAEENALLRFAELRQRWDDHGILAVLYRLVTERAASLLARPGGTRSVTNWLQLAELAQQAEERHGSPSRLLRWLRELVVNAEARNAVGDDALLRLETDEDAIQIVTLHRCKGLEYPLTILVDPWRSPQQRKTPTELVDPLVGPFAYHNEAGVPHLELGGADRTERAQQAFAEELQEDIRLTYVGLTRARYRCSLLWPAEASGALWKNGTHWLLCDPESRSLAGEKPANPSTTSRVQALSTDSPALIGVHETEENTCPVRWQGASTPGDAGTLAARPLGALPEDVWAVTSFSAIKRGVSTDENALELLDVDEAAAPDDAALAMAATATSAQAATSEATGTSVTAANATAATATAAAAAAASVAAAAPAFLIGAGRSYGNGFHLVMEEILEALPADDDAGASIAERQLARFGVGAENGAASGAAGAPAAADDTARVASVASPANSAEPAEPAGPASPSNPAPATTDIAMATWHQARRVLTQRLTAHDGTPVSLADLAPAARVAEMEFDMAMRHNSTQALAEVLDAHGHPHTARLLRQRRVPLHGLLHGFIDLTFEWEGRYYVLDYKTNHLGDRIGDYGQAAMDRAMTHSSYDLQYLLYTLAVDRWLRSLNPGYRYEQHFGGVYYLFVRGMHDRGAEGVWFTCPDPALVAALAEVMCEPTEARA
jgi:exodeoxyribonuclease V beta subunit